MSLALQSCSPHCDTRYWCFGFAREAFLSKIFLKINGHPWNDTNLDTRNNLYSFSFWVIQSSSLHWDTWYWRFDLIRKAFLPTIILIIKVYLWNETNLDARNNLHSFWDGHYNHVLHIGIHDIDAFVWQEKLFIPPFSL